MALFLNSDAYPGHRNHPVYELQVGSNEVVVLIEEQVGKWPHLKAIVNTPTLEYRKDGKGVERYKAPLTGDIWVLISHCYTWAEVEPLLPANLPLPIRNALSGLYKCLVSLPLDIDFPANDGRPALQMRVEFVTPKNVRDNVASAWHVATTVLPRTHPAAYVALLCAAYSSGITRLVITSGWRPMFGSIAHRAGRGLDVGIIARPPDSILLNRDSLKDAMATGDGKNVSAAERNAYRALRRAKEDVTRSERESADAKRLIDLNRNPAQASALIRNADDKKKQVTEARNLLLKAQSDWDHVRTSQEPGLLHEFRQALSAHPMVTQLLDPWYLDTNTQDKILALPNQQISNLECAHNNHLHITVREP